MQKPRTLCKTTRYDTIRNFRRECY